MKGIFLNPEVAEVIRQKARLVALITVTFSKMNSFSRNVKRERAFIYYSPSQEINNDLNNI